jgi:rubrerythrin
MMEETKVSRRTFLKGAALAAAGTATVGLLSACKETPPAAPSSASNAPAATPAPTAPAASETVVGTTYDNLLTALQGETNATTKYTAFAEIAKNAGFDQVARLFTATAAAEIIHIELEFALATAIDPATKRPDGETPPKEDSDENLITGAKGEIYETSDMYPKFIAKAQEEGNTEAVNVFTRAKLAEGYHAELYMDIYNMIDKPDGSTYYLCPICGYIHKGEDNQGPCPICSTAFSSFTAY